MRTVLTIFALVAVFTGLALAESWNGKLLDATCYDKEKEAKPCDANGATAMFAVDISGKIYRLDQAGNAKAAEALKSRADRSADPAKPPEGSVSAKITGTADGETIKVEAVEVR